MTRPQRNRSISTLCFSRELALAGWFEENQTRKDGEPARDGKNRVKTVLAKKGCSVHSSKESDRIRGRLLLKWARPGR
jgi:hypothetical protein